MSDVCNKKARLVRRQRSIYQVHYCLQKQREEMAKPFGEMKDFQVSAYDRQVAGHRTTEDTKYLGLLQCNNGTILKPILKPSQQREVDFYKRLSTTEDPDLQELRKFTPKYYGTKNFTYNGHEQEYIILEDLTQGMVEPCIMDLKIGKRTWDPLANEEKIAKEKLKYALCKQQYGFCIPGYQVYKLSSGKLHKFSKEYGKKLHGPLVIENIRNFLNATETGVCRALVLQLVSQVWRIHEWAKRARPLRLHSASLLLVYDATELRRCCPFPDEALDRLHQNHSFNHNYDDNLSKIRIDYRAVLDRLSRDDVQTPYWARITLIDFAHAFFNDDVETPTIDDNIKEGLDNVVAILENLLRETVDQIKW